ncbi:MAG: redoxin domain-containing protein [Ignavibacteriae bacterium]|nr:redoxin domain-containing protein [Ignavibacteriota bacterium]
MRLLTSLLLFIVLSISMQALASPKPLASIKPEKPSIGQNVSVSYLSTHPKAKLLGARDVTLHVLMLREGEMPLLHEIPMTAKGALWAATLPPLETKTQMLLFRFVAGDKTDDNGGDVWTALVHAGNKPVKGALQQQALVLRSGGSMGFEKKKDADGAKVSLRKELELHPSNVSARVALWNILLRENPDDKLRETIGREADELFAAQEGNETAQVELLPVFDRIGRKQRAEELRAAAVAKNPRGKIAESAARGAINRERDAAKRLALVEAFMRDFQPDEQVRRTLESTMANSLVQLREYDRALMLVEMSPRKDGAMMNTIAWAMLEDSTQPGRAPEFAHRASDIARRGIDLLRAPETSTKPAYLSTREWKENNDYQLAMILHTYATALLRIGRLDEALVAMEEANTRAKGENEEIASGYLDALNTAGRHDKALETARAAVRAGKGGEELLGRYRRAYAAVHGSAEGAEADISAAREYARKELREKLRKKRLSLPARDFTLKTMDGGEVTLAALKGKVVVIDFWATWCGPCKASFPYLQKVYEKYSGNDRVRILALDTWENEKGAKREELVKKFIADNKYTFPVLYDDGMVDAYGVTGIPTKFVLDTRGAIAFKSIGFNGGEEMMNELTLQIDMLLSSEL